MASNKDRTVSAVLDRHGETYCSELGIGIDSNTPSELFRWLCASILFSARIGAGQALKAARALADQGWTTAEKMSESTWDERTRALNRSGYARYDESTSRMLGDTVDRLLHEYQGDLRKLRDKAEKDGAAERRLLKQFKGLGDVGVDIFMREIQAPWDEIYPFADKKALNAAKRLGLGSDAKSLARYVDRRDFPRLVAALVRTDLAKDYDDVVERTSGRR